MVKTILVHYPFFLLSVVEIKRDLSLTPRDIICRVQRCKSQRRVTVWRHKEAVEFLPESTKGNIDRIIANFQLSVVRFKQSCRQSIG